MGMICRTDQLFEDFGPFLELIFSRGNRRSYQIPPICTCCNQVSTLLVMKTLRNDVFVHWASARLSPWLYWLFKEVDCGKKN